MDETVVPMPREDEPSEPKTPYYVLGLDPGIASCGFCLLDLANHRIVEMGAHLFATPQEPKTRMSLAVGRRNARSMRRNIKRTRDRLSHVLDLMKAEGIVPADAQKQWFQPRKGEKQVLRLRADGLDRLLSDREWAQVLYSLCVRRGYIPHGEGGYGDGVSAEDGKVLKAIRENDQKLVEGGFRTVGEMLAHGGKSRNKGGSYDLCVTNAQINTEVARLFESQRTCGSTHADTSFEKNYLACLNWQKETCGYDDRIYATVGSCSYFPERKRAASADVTSELLRAQERLAHVRLIDPDGREHPIPYEERQSLINDILFSCEPLKGNKDCRVRYSDIRKRLDWSGRGSIKGIDEAAEKTTDVFVPRAWKAYRSSGLPADLLRRMLDDLDLGDSIGEAMTYASSEASLRGRLEELELSEEEIGALLRTPFTSKVFKGYDSRCLDVQRMLLGAFEDECVKTLYDAEEAVGLAQLRLSQEGEKSSLLPPYLDYDPTCRNPVVLRALARMRRIVNAIIRVHGVPNEIHIELGRELKLSVKEKEKIAKSNKENKARKKRIAERAAQILEIRPEEVKGSVIRKYALWEEQRNFDAYTGAPIDEERMVKDSTYTQIDHILPYSRTCDDSRANKVLVLSKSNQDKKERSPYEWMTSGEVGAPSWDEFCARVQASRLPYKKKSRLLERDLESQQDKFIERNLNDDRYMSVAVKDYIERTLAFPETDGKKRHVYAVAGGATANLRHAWHLNYGEGDTKDRSDDRHHAVDAAVIAACNASAVKRLADASARKHLVPKDKRAALFDGTEPWPGFADDVRAAREVVVPTRMVSHGVTGRAFKDMPCSFKGTRADGKGELSLKNKSKASGNYVLDGEGGARVVDGLAFLRLWLDPDARSKGKVKGRWYGEPVYYADIPAIENGSYVPRYMKGGSARNLWPEVPEVVRSYKPVMIYPGDIMSVGGQLARFKTVDIDSANWEVDPLPGLNERGAKWPTITNLGIDDIVTIVEEDVLGRCYYRL